MTLRNLLLFLALACCGVPHAVAQPSSPAVLRQRINELEQQLETLRTELEALRTERDELKKETALLAKALAKQSSIDFDLGKKIITNQPSDDLPSVPVSALTQDPLASPDALFVALVLDYRDTLASDETAEGPPDMDDVEDWTRDVRSKLEGPASWLARIESISRPDADDTADTAAPPAPPRMKLTVLDPDTGFSISRPVRIDIPRRFESRFPDTIEPDAPLYAQMRVRLEATPRYQPGRTSPGPFNFPPFIGPHAGFGYELEIIGFKFVEKDELKDATQITPPHEPVER